MKKITLLLFFGFLAFFAKAQCNYTLEMNDSWGDGWNGGTMDVLVNGVVVLDDVTLDDGAQGTLAFPVNAGDDVTTMHVADGQYPGEMSYRILDALGAEAGAGDPTADITTGTITAACPTCDVPVATFAVVDDCANSGGFLIECNVTDIGAASGVTISNDFDANTIAITAAGVYNAGPFTNGTDVIVTLTNDDDGVCNTSSSALTQVGCPPTNDECIDAIPVACDDVVTGSTVLATDSGNNASNDVWYSFLGTGLEDVTLSLCNSAYDTYIRVFDACGGTEIAGNDDSCATQSEVTFTSDGVTTYYIMIEGFNTSNGDYELQVSCSPNIPPPANDDCGAATPLTLGVELFGETNAGATQSAGDQPTCDSFGFIADVWYSFVAPASGEVTIQTTLGTADNANVAVYDDCANLDANAIGPCTDDVGAVNADYTGLTPGATYYVKVWNDGALPPPTAGRVEGSFDILASDTTLSIGGVEANNAFEYFPNPVNDKLCLRAQSNIQNVVVFNMLGQQVIRTSPNLTSSDVDMSTLQAGAYFVQVTIEDKTETIRIIRK